MRAAVALLTSLAWCTAASAQTSVLSYRPFIGDLDSGFAVWNESRLALETAAVAGEARRPVLPGVHGRNLEMLQDYYVRYYPKSTNGGLRSEATRRIAKASDFRIGALRGFMAEAIYLEEHPGAKYPAKPNTRQVDVYFPQPDGRRGIHGVQIKFHIDGDPAKYARDLRKYSVQRFAVPDDHVEPLKAHLEERGIPNTRVEGIGATSREIDQRTRQARREAIAVRTTPFVMLGAATALELGPVAYQLLTGQLTAERLTKQVAHAAPSLGAATITDQALKHKNFGNGNWRGGVRGNAIVGSVYFVVDTLMTTRQYGGPSEALASPEFLINRGTALMSLGGSLWICGKAGAATAVATGPVIGGGVSLVCFAALAPGASVAAEKIGELVTPDDRAERRMGRYKEVKDGLSKDLEGLYQLPTHSQARAVSSS